MSKLPDAKQTLEFAAVATLGSIIGLAVLMLIEQIFGFRFPASYVAAGLLVAVCDLGRHGGSGRDRPRRTKATAGLNETTTPAPTRASIVVGAVATIGLLILTDRLFGFTATYFVGGILVAAGLLAEITGPAAEQTNATAANDNGRRVSTSDRVAEISRDAAGLRDRTGV